MRLTHKSAIAVINQNTAFTANYSGILCRDASLMLGRSVRDISNGVPVVERLDKALICVSGGWSEAELAYLKKTPPGAIVCSPAQLDRMTIFAQCLAQIGVVRLCFLDPQLASDWVCSIG